MPDAPTPLDLDAIRDDLDASDRDLKKWVRLPVKRVDAVLAEIDRLRADVARLEEDLSDRTMALVEMTHPDRPAPAWDEEATRVALVAAQLASVSKTMYDGYPSAFVRSNEEAADAALAVVRDHLPVKHDRETVIEAMSAALHVTTDRIPGLNPGPVLSADCASVEVAADAVLSLLPGRSEATVKDEALRGAAGFFRDTLHDHGAAGVLDRLAAEGGADRG